MVVGVLLTGLLMVGLIIYLLNSALVTVRDRTNELDVQRSEALAQAAVESAIEHISNQVTDSAYWDDAYQQVYRKNPNAQWLFDTWGTVTSPGANYDGVFIVDERDHLLWGYSAGQKIKSGDIAWLGQGATTLLWRAAHQDEGHFKALGGLTRTNSGAAVVAVSLIKSNLTPDKRAGSQRRYLVMTRAMGTPMLAELSHDYRVSGLRFSRSRSAPSPHLTLSAPDGSFVGMLSWQADRPGSAAAAIAHPQIRDSLLIAALLITVCAFAAAYMLRRIAETAGDSRRASLTDALSGLPNRRALMTRLCEIHSRDWEPGVESSIVFIDLDGFKDVNDTYGHETGDALIRHLSQSLMKQLRAGAFLARLGGDEFALLLTEKQSLMAVTSIAERILTALSEPVTIGERRIQVGASIGIAHSEPKQCSGQELFRRADVAMYYAKEHGKGRYQVYTAAIEIARTRMVNMENELREGLKRDEFEVFYQPVVDAGSHEMVAVEALVRWPRRPGGSVGPDEFIKAAETSGMIHQLGLFVLRRACEDILPFDLKLCVNVSPSQFRDPDFEQKVLDVLAQTGFPATRLELELTEGYLIGHPRRAMKVMATLKAAGISFALDDFGTGYTSINYLRQYGFDRIKIDKSLAGNIERDAQASVLVAGSVYLANGLAMSVTAEGVETVAQANLLKLAGCQNLQGFLFSQARSIADLAAMRHGQSSAA
jgi:diguanylate cyclase (GGDEF)-like protein